MAADQLMIHLENCLKRRKQGIYQSPQFLHIHHKISACGLPPPPLLDGNKTLFHFDRWAVKVW